MLMKNSVRFMSFWKGVLALYLIFLVLFFAATPFFTVLLYQETDLSRSILPELIGFCLQGMFLVVVLVIFDRHATLHAKRNLKITLRSFLSTVVHRCLDDPIPPAAGSYLPGPAQMEAAIGAVHTNGLDAAAIHRVREFAEKELISLESLAAIAAQIDAEHLALWSSLAESMRQIRDANGESASREAVLGLMEKIQRFDTLPVL